MSLPAHEAARTKNTKTDTDLSHLTVGPAQSLICNKAGGHSWNRTRVSGFAVLLTGTKMYGGKLLKVLA